MTEEVAKPKSFRERIGEKASSAWRIGKKVGAGAVIIGGAALGVKAAASSAKAHGDAAAQIGGAIAAEAPAAAKHKLTPFKPAKQNIAALKIQHIAEAAKIDPVGVAHGLANPQSKAPKQPPKKPIGLSTAGSGSQGLHIVAGKPQTYGPALPPKPSRWSKVKGKLDKRDQTFK